MLLVAKHGSKTEDKKIFASIRTTILYNFPIWGNFTSALTKTISVDDYSLRVKLRGNSPFSKAISDAHVNLGDGNEIRFGRFTNRLQLLLARKRKSVTK